MMRTKKAREALTTAERESKWRNSEIDRRIARDYSSSMSNAKWNKLLQALVESPVEITTLKWRRFGYKEDFTQESSWSSVDDWNERAVCVTFDYHWLLFKHIEWVEVESLNVNELQVYLNNVAEFDLEPTSKGIRMYGYRPIK